MLSFSAMEAENPSGSTGVRILLLGDLITVHDASSSRTSKTQTAQLLVRGYESDAINAGSKPLRGCPDVVHRPWAPIPIPGLVKGTLSVTNRGSPQGCGTYFALSA